MRKYKNLAAEVVRADMTMTALADASGISRQMLSRKVHGHSEITVPEAIRIWNALNRPCSLEVLFATEE